MQNSETEQSGRSEGGLDQHMKLTTRASDTHRITPTLDPSPSDPISSYFTTTHLYKSSPRDTVRTRIAQCQQRNQPPRHWAAMETRMIGTLYTPGPSKPVLTTSRGRSSCRKQQYVTINIYAVLPTV